MSDDADALDADLYRRARALLEPGEIDLVGAVVHTGVGSDDEPALHGATLEVGRCIADHAGYDPDDVYVYSGNDDPEFGLNQHQGLTIEGDEFVWECQQLLRDGTFDVVFYYEEGVDNDALVEAIRERGYEAVGVEP